MGLNVPLYNENSVLKEVLGLETVVQFIELAFYVTFGFILPTVAGSVDIAIYRYLDWFITTPTMLLSTITFMDYIRRKEVPPEDKTTKELPTLWRFLQENWLPTLIIILANFFMLCMGLLKEQGVVDIWTSTILGFMGFGVVFYTMYKKYSNHHKINEYLWKYMVGTWGMYGVAAWFPNIIKNTTYNLLDIVSKNFYSVFLTTYILNLPQ